MLLPLLINAATQTSTPASPQSNIFSLGFFTILIVMILVRRVYRATYGTRFSMLRLFRIPVVYSIITAIALVFLPLEYVFYSAGAAVIGLVAGLFLGEGAKFYYQSGSPYYKRSPVILIIWLSSFIARIGIELILSPGTGLFASSSSYYTATVIVDLLLAGTTGLVVGEAIKNYRKYNEFYSSNQNTADNDVTFDQMR